jgi:hypothetical protein
MSRKPPAPSEADIVVQIQDGLRALGYTVLRIGQHRADLAGQTAGTPDLMVTRNTWLSGFWIALEVKRPGGRLSPAQRQLVDDRRIFVAHDFDEARAIMERIPA